MSRRISNPRMINGLVVVELDDGLLLEGASQRRVLRGRAARSLLPRLLPALDGTRTIKELPAALPDVPADHIHRAVTLLQSLGLVEDGDEQRLDRIEVLVVADQQSARVLASQLDAVGIGETSTTPHAALTTRRLDLGPRPDLVVVVERPQDRRSLGRLDQSCARAGVGWLRTAINPAGGEIGPYFRPDGIRCYRCFLDLATEGISRRAPDLSIVEGWAALVAIEVLQILDGSVTDPQVTVFDLDRWDDHRTEVPPCSSCSYPSCTPLADCNQSFEGR
jgi:hypothetical protein